MSIATFSDLKTSIASYLARDDLTTLIPDFITLFEAFANRKLGVRRAETTTNLTTSSGSVALPSDFMEWRRLQFNSSIPVVLEYTEPNYFYGRWGDRAAGDPVAFTIVGSNILVGAVDDATNYTLDYFATLTALSVSNTTNWLLTNYPDAYLAGSLVEAFIYIGDSDKAAIWKSRRDTAIDEIILLDAKARAPSRIRIDGPVV